MNKDNTDGSILQVERLIQESPRRPQSIMGTKVVECLKGWLEWVALIEWGGGSLSLLVNEKGVDV